MSLIQVRRLYAGYGQARVLRDVSLDIDEGEAVAVVGRNGAGKSTLINAFFGAATLHGGQILVDGQPLNDLPAYMAARRGISVSPQGRLVLQQLTVRENLLLGAAGGRRGPWNLNRIYSLFPVLQQRRHQMGTHLSGGQQQMLAIGRALMTNPRMLLLDEPSEGLSPVMIDELANVINAIRESGTGVLIVEQHLNLVRRTSQRFVVLAKGEVIDQGLTAQIDAPRHQSALTF